MIKSFKMGFVAVFAAALVATAAVPAQAQLMGYGSPTYTAGTDVPPGCSADFYNMQQNRAQAEVVRNNAAARQLIKRPSSVNALTCFDQALMVSAQAGSIFSDRMPGATPPFNPQVALGLGSFLNGPFGPGTTGTLAGSLQTVVDPVLNNLLSTFSGSLTSALGATLSSSFGGVLNGILGSGGGLAGIMGNIAGFDMDCTVMQDTYEGKVIGQGPDPQFKFKTIHQWASEVGTGGGEDIGPEARVQMIANQDVLDRLMENTELILSPGIADFNPIVPSLSPRATVMDVINNF